jgi:hypothetical protein
VPSLKFGIVKLVAEEIKIGRGVPSGSNPNGLISL